MKYLRPDSNHSSCHALLTLHSRYGPIFLNVFHCKHSDWQLHSALAPVTLRSRRIVKYFNQSVIGARVERDCQCEFDHSPITVLQGLSEGCDVGSLCLPLCLHHGNGVNQLKLLLDSAGVRGSWTPFGFPDIFMHPRYPGMHIAIDS